MASDHPEPGPDSVPDSAPDPRPDTGPETGPASGPAPGPASGPASGREPDAVPAEPSRPDDPEPELDVDAVFADIVAHWESSAPASDNPEPAPSFEPAPAPYPAPVERPAADQVVDDEEDHFVPPPPPPLPTVEPRRKLAWAGLVGAPVLALLLIALGIVVPGWVALGMVVAVVGGFGYLVATMSSSSPQDPWSGDDGAKI